MHGVAGEEVLASAGCTGAAADRDQVEDRADVAVEPVVALAREHLRAVAQVMDAARGERAVVRGRPWADVVGRGDEAAADDTRGDPVDPRDGVLLLRVLQEG